MKRIAPTDPRLATPYFANPQYTRAFLHNRESLTGGTDATAIISEDRTRELAISKPDNFHPSAVPDT